MPKLFEFIDLNDLSTFKTEYDKKVEADITTAKTEVVGASNKAYASKITIEQNDTTGVVTFKLYSSDNTLLDTKTLDLDTEHIIKSVSLDYANKKLVFTMNDDTTIETDISDLIDGLKGEIQDVADDLADEVSRAGNAESDLNDRITAIENDYLTESDKTELANDISAEETRAKGVENSKADKVTNGTENNIVLLDANGNIKDSGKSINDVGKVATVSVGGGTPIQPDQDKNIDLPAYPTRVSLQINNVDNTKDTDKPVSTAQQEAIDSAGHKIDLEIDSTNFKVVAKLYDKNNTLLSTSNEIDLPLESVVVSGRYDSLTKEVVLTLQNGSVIRFSVADLVSGLQTQIDSTHKLSSDLVDDAGNTNKFVTASEKALIATNATDIANIKDGEEIDSFADVESALENKQSTIDSAHKLSSDLVDDTNNTNKFVTQSEKTLWNSKVNAYEVADITALTTAQVNTLKVGDVVVKNENGNKHNYIVTYKEDEVGICLTYADAENVETVSYDYLNNEWAYNSTDITNIVATVGELVTKEWRAKVNTRFEGNDIWTDGENIYYSNYDTQKQLVNGEWVDKTWNGLTGFFGKNIWTDGENIYYSYNDSISGTAGNYVLDKTTSTWSEKTWSGIDTATNGMNIWTDGENIYYSNGSFQYVLINKETSTWDTKRWHGFYNVSGFCVWTDGENIYYSVGSNQYVLDKETSTWNTKTWNGLNNFDGRYIWTDGENIYYSYESSQYVLDKATSTWVAKTWAGLTTFDGNKVWEDNDGNIYYSDNSGQYELFILTSPIKGDLEDVKELLDEKKADKSTTYTKTETDTLLNDKVSKVTGKGLSTNDFTDSYKQKVDTNETAIATETTRATTQENKALYHLGAYDTVSGNVITRRTGYVDDSTRVMYSWARRVCANNSSVYYFNITLYGDWKTVSSSTLNTNFINNLGLTVAKRIDVASNGTAPDNSIGIAGYDGGACDLSIRCDTYTTLESFIQNVGSKLRIQYWANTEYADTPIENQNILPLDTNMANKIRQKVVDGLQLVSAIYQGNGTPDPTMTIRVTAEAELKANQTYHLSLNSSATNTAVYIYYGGTLVKQAGTGNLDFSFTTPYTGNHKIIFMAGGGDGTILVSNISNLMLVEGNHPYPHSDFNQKEHITNAQAELLKSEEEKVKNLWGETWELGSILPSTGVDVASSDKIRSAGYIGIEPNKTYVFNQNNAQADTDYLYFYASDKSFISSTVYSHSTSINITFTAPNNAYYMRFIVKGTTYSNSNKVIISSGDILHKADVFNGSKINSSLIPSLAYAPRTSYLFSANSQQLTNINVNAGAGGRTILVLFSAHADAGNGTVSGVGFIRCGYSQNYFSYEHLGGINPTTHNISFSTNASGYLTISSTSGYYAQVRFDFIGVFK